MPGVVNYAYIKILDEDGIIADGHYYGDQENKRLKVFIDSQQRTITEDHLRGVRHAKKFLREVFPSHKIIFTDKM